MTIPVQPKVDENRTARAPYNFIPLPEKVITVRVDDLPDQGVYDPNLHTGCIECELTTSSPVYVRAGLTPEQAKAGKESKDLPDFFYLNDKNQPIIPGSSLRGMLRTLVEIVTFSKIGSVSKTPLVYRSVGGTTNHDENYRLQMMHSDNEVYKAGETKLYTPRIRGGYMVKVGGRDWAIRPAKTIDGTTCAHIGMSKYDLNELDLLKGCRNAYRIYIKTGPYQYQDVKGGFLKVRFAKVIDNDANMRPGLRSATLAISGKMFSKKSEAVIYEQDENAPLLPLSDEQIDAYNLQRSKEQESLLGQDGALNDGQPVFYLLNETSGKVIFFGHARMFRVPYHHSPFDFVPEYAQSSDEPSDPSLVDFAEAMFGFTRKVEKGAQRQRAYAGRVLCGDAELLNGQKDIWLSNTLITPKILSGPKPTTFQHYLVQQEPNYYPALDKPKPDTRLRDFDTIPGEETVIRGHKFYWHKGQVGLDELGEKATPKTGDTQHTQIRPLKAGVTFKFQVRFENLSDEELGALMWILNIASDKNVRLKLGMGKPLGMGAIQIKPQLQKSDPADRYASLMENQAWSGGHQSDAQLGNSAMQSFVDFMSDELETDFMKHNRILALLTMLQWPGPVREWTRYMEIEHPDAHEKRGKRNEYKERPVLPSPFGVWSKHKS